MIELDAAELAAAAGGPVTAYTVTPIDPEQRVHSVTGGVYRVAGTTVDGGPASLVVKVVRHGVDPDPAGMWLSGAEPAHRNYWKREWLAFDSGLLDTLPGELRAPRTLLTTTRSDREAWVWMEDVEGDPGTGWPLAAYASAVFDLGTTQGAYATGAHPLPTDAWLSRQWLRGWVVAAHARLTGEQRWDDERVRDLLPLRERVLDLLGEQDRLLAIVGTAPQTLVHNDLWPANLIAADDGTTVALDWSQVGVGSVGQDLDQQVLDPVWMQVLPAGSPADLEAQVLPAYLAGLRHAGLDVGEQELRTWYAAAAGAHYAPMLATAVSVAVDEAAAEAVTRRWNRPSAAVVADRIRVIEHALHLGEWALESAP